ncbi:uncharacterized protein LOC111699356 [Eurytemora carolleeae]|uniref:uncharacterized protein LOC111699356 n=1 Tax=Eurytemora carolleeae TaxID=1294199 RepID=UPI000C766042|nr:uncharacterized protein LOC111699356 [Eurytemora carolleeae]|eukprot:XP_023325783.1 uncharacterized protein LOC111699356 [Eurytemora affinis]
METKVHAGLTWFIIIFSLPLLIWAIFVHSDTMPALIKLMTVMESMNESDLIKHSKNRTQEVELIFREIESILSISSICGIIISILIILRTSTLVLTISGDRSCKQCCKPIQYIWAQVRTEVNFVLMETTPQHSPQE